MNKDMIELTNKLQALCQEYSVTIAIETIKEVGATRLKECFVYGAGWHCLRYAHSKDFNKETICE